MLETQNNEVLESLKEKIIQLSNTNRIGSRNVIKKLKKIKNEIDINQKNIELLAIIREHEKLERELRGFNYKNSRAWKIITEKKWG